jgi:hypothetical protein
MSYSSHTRLRSTSGRVTQSYPTWLPTSRHSSFQGERIERRPLDCRNDQSLLPQSHLRYPQPTNLGYRRGDRPAMSKCTQTECLQVKKHLYGRPAVTTASVALYLRRLRTKAWQYQELRNKSQRHAYRNSKYLELHVLRLLLPDHLRLQSKVLDRTC